MIDKISDDARADELEAQINRIAERRTDLQNLPFGMSIHDELDRLYQEERRLTNELHAIRPYSVVRNGDRFNVSHKGVFVGDDSEWLSFETAEDAAAWVASA